MEVIKIVTYVLAGIFVVAFALQFLKYHKMPTHLRWELYPLAGEKHRPWGGSYLEDPDWWKKPAEEKSFIREMVFMGKEIFYFKEYLHSNRSLWYIVFPFHMGIFLFVGFFALLIVGTLTMLATDIAISAESANIWGKFLYYVTLITGVAGFVLGTIGCLALFIRKIVDQTMSAYTRRIEYINILFVLAVFLTGLLAWGIVDPTFEASRTYMYNLITFGDMQGTSALLVTHGILLALLLAYIPFTNMMHFFAKHFTFNSVRWDDRPNFRGSQVENSLGPLLEQRVNWAAPHLQSINRWSDVAKHDSGADTSGRASRKGES